MAFTDSAIRNTKPAGSWRHPLPASRILARSNSAFEIRPLSASDFCTLIEKCNDQEYRDAGIASLAVALRTMKIGDALRVVVKTMNRIGRHTLVVHGRPLESHLVDALPLGSRPERVAAWRKYERSVQPRYRDALRAWRDQPDEAIQK